MRPKGVESNHFAYHLDQLVRAKLVQKKGRAYLLTTQGLALADRISHTELQVRKQPHIVTTIQVTNGAGKAALFTHAFQPYLNLVGWPQGRMHFEETIAQAAARELFEKTGLQDVTLQHRGIMYIQAVKEGEMISKILSHVFSGTVKGAPALSSQFPNRGTASWGSPTVYPPEQCMPGFHEVTQLLDKAEPLFFAEVETSLQ